MSTNIQNPTPKKEFDIHKRIFNFIVRVRSVTSIGANDQEADGSTSRRQFYNILTIVKKETKETNYWLNVISATNPSFQKRMESLVNEGKEIEAVVSSIVKKGRLT